MLDIVTLTRSGWLVYLGWLVWFVTAFAIGKNALADTEAPTLVANVVVPPKTLALGKSDIPQAEVAKPILLSVGSAVTKTREGLEEAAAVGLTGGSAPPKSPLCGFVTDQERLRKDTSVFLLGGVPFQANYDEEELPRVKERLKSAKTCAVVSNSGVLLAHKHGAAIDAADVVFRFNDAQIGGELVDVVGARDDIRILNHKVSGGVWMELLEQNATRSKKFEHSSPNTTTKMPVYIKKLDRVLRDPRRLADKMARSFFGTSLGKAGTTGLTGVVLAMFLCDEVKAYGFAATPTADKTPFHYFGDLEVGIASRNPDPAHAKTFNTEKRFFQHVALNDDVNATDVVVIPGFPSLKCD
mmetsp:Transcript_80/g.112  ORF Transcript_80/g.112 Transcript_80/m.112 type:complete len:355 (-) Transcript_80:33-1097(-)